jgi:hypothetical protein
MALLQGLHVYRLSCGLLCYPSNEDVVNLANHGMKLEMACIAAGSVCAIRAGDHNAKSATGKLHFQDRQTLSLCHRLRKVQLSPELVP